MKNLEELQLMSTDITEIPALTVNHIDSFKKLIKLTIEGLKIKKIADYAFSHLDSLEKLDFMVSSIEKIPEHAFDLNKTTEKLILSYLRAFYLMERKLNAKV